MWQWNVDGQDPGVGEAQIMASRDVATAWPMAQPMSQPVIMRPETVEVSAVLVDATLRQRVRTLPSVSDSLIAEGCQSHNWTRSGSGLPQRDGSVMDECTDFAGRVAAVATSPVVFVGDVAVKVMLPTVAGAAALADFAQVVAADATHLADAGILFLANPAGVLTIGVAPLADAEMVTVTVADLADAGILFPADLAGPASL